MLRAKVKGAFCLGGTVAYELEIERYSDKLASAKRAYDSLCAIASDNREATIEGVLPAQLLVVSEMIGVFTQMIKLLRVVEDALASESCAG